MLILYSVSYFETEGGLVNICKSLKDGQSGKARVYIFGGVFKLIRSVRGNWRPVVVSYVRILNNFAKATSCPVIVQLPWRDDSVGIFRVQREQVKITFGIKLTFY